MHKFEVIVALIFNSNNAFIYYRLKHTLLAILNFTYKFGIKLEFHDFID